MTTAKRSWDDDDTDSKNRGSMLALLGLGLILSIGVLVYIGWTFFGRKPQTWVHEFTRFSPDDGLPELVEWKSDDLIAVAKDAGLRPWEPLRSFQARDINKQDKGNVESDLANLPDPMHAEDTLVILLRCHAAVMQSRDGSTSSPSEPWVCVLLVGGSEPLPFSHFLELLAKKRYQNTLVLADICDLNYVPSRGWIYNPIASYIETACKNTGASLDKNQHVWVLCAAADGQSTHFDRHGKSLFEEACVKGIENVNQDQTLTLASYCDSINRYCAGASLQSQSPVFYHVNAAGENPRVLDKAGWERAGKVAISRFLGNGRGDSKKDNDGSDPPSGDGSESQKKSPSKEEPRDQASPAGNPDRAQEEKKEKQWTLKPSDYAPLQWRGRKLDQEQQVGSHDVIPESNAYLSTRSDLKRIWESSEDLLDKDKGLSEDEAKKWPAIRDRYRIYFDSVSALIFWRDLAFTLSLPRGKGKVGSNVQFDLITEFQKAIQEIEKMRRELRVDQIDQNASVIEGQQPGNERPFGGMRSQLERIISDLLKEDWNWSSRHRCLVLLRSPLLDEEQRRALMAALEDKAISAVKPADEFERGDDPGLLQRIKVFAECASTVATWYTTKTNSEAPLNAPEALSTETLLAWGQEYLNHQLSIDSSPDGMSEFQRWHYCSIVDLPTHEQLQNLESMPASILFYPGNPHRLLLSAKCGAEEKPWIDFKSIDAPVQVRLQRSYAYPKSVKRSQDSFSLRWKAENLAAEQMQLKVNSKPWPHGMVREFASSDARIEVQWVGPKDSEIPTNAKLRFEYLNDGAHSQGEFLTLPIYRDADSIGLVVMSKPDNRSRQPNSEGILEVSGPPLVHTASHYELQLQNNLPDRERRVRLKVYSMAPNPDLSDLPREPPIAESTIMTLGKAKADPRPETVSFVARESDPVGLTIRPDSLLGSDLVCVVDEFASLDSSSGTNQETAVQPVSSEKPIKKHRYRLRLIPNRLSKYLRPKPRLVDGRPEIEFEVASGFWTNPQQKLIPIPILVRGWKKYRDGFDPMPSEVDLDPASADFEKPIVLQPQMPSATVLLQTFGKDHDCEFMVDIGEYPRAYFFRFRPDQPEDRRFEQADDFPQRIGNPVISALTKSTNSEQRNMKPILDNGSELTLIFPNREWGDDEVRWSKMDDDRESDPIDYDSLRVTIGPRGIADGVGKIIQWQLFPLPANSTDASELNNAPPKLDGGEWRDRTFFAKPRFLESDFSLQFEVTELDQWIPFPKPVSKAASTRWRLDLIASEEQKKSIELIFDREEPARGRLVVEGPNQQTAIRLNESEKIRIELIPQREGGVLDKGGSGLKDIQFWLAFDKNDVWNGKNPIGTVPANPTATKVSYSLSGEEIGAILKKSKRNAGRYYLKARTYDRAGNVQSGHEPLEIEWTPVTK